MAWNRVGHASDLTKYTSTAVASDSVTIAEGAAAGDFIFVWVTCDSGSVPAFTCGDPTNGVNAYTPKLSVDKTGDQMVKQFYFANSAAVAANLVVTVGFSPSRPWVGMYAAVWHSDVATPDFDVEDGQLQTGPAEGTDTVRTTATNTNAADLIIASSRIYFSTSTAGNSVAAGTGPPAFSEDLNVNTSFQQYIEMQNYVQSGSGSAEGYWSPTAGDAVLNSLSMFMAVKAVAGGVVVPVFYHQLQEQGIA